MAHLHKEIGNVTEMTAITFDFSVKHDQRATVPAVVPFQLQVHFKKVANGMECLRVVTKNKEITKSREDAEREAKVAIIGQHVAQTSAKLAMKGEYSAARANAFSNKRLMKKLATKDTAQLGMYSQWNASVAKLERALTTAQTAEHAQGLQLSDDEDDVDAGPQTVQPMVKPKKHELRSKGRDDKTAAVLYSMKAYSSKPVSMPSPKQKGKPSGSADTFRDGDDDS